MKRGLARLNCRTLRASVALALVGPAGAACHADDFPAVGMLEVLPVMADGMHVNARPVYLLTQQKLAAPAVFSGLQGMPPSYTVVCCFQVSDLTPLDLKAELARYAADQEFVEHMKSVRGYRYVYAARPSTDKARWTPLMRTLADIAANPADGSPFTAPAVAAQFATNTVPATFKANGVPVTLRYRIDRRSGRSVYVFSAAGTKVEFSEESFPH